MRNIFKISLLAVLILCNLAAKSQNKNNYTLSGVFEGLPNKTKVILTTQQKDTIQTTFSKGNEFVFRGSLPDDGRFLFVMFDTLVSKLSSRAIFVTSNPISIQGKIGSRDILIDGSPSHDKYLNVIKEADQRTLKIRPFLVKVDSINQKLYSARDKKDSAEIVILERKVKVAYQTVDSVKKIYIEIDKKWIEENKKDKYTPYFMLPDVQRLGVTYCKKVFGEFPKEVQESYYGKELKTIISTIEMSARISIGVLMPNLIVLNRENEKTAIREIVKSNKLTLIDCWASWCTPCRAEVPELKRIYAKYKDKGFNIIGISSDKSILAWEKAITDDQTPWVHFIEDQGKLFTNTFKLQAIPAYILVDNTSKMIAFDCAMSPIPRFGGSLRGEALDKKLEELLGSSK